MDRFFFLNYSTVKTRVNFFFLFLFLTAAVCVRKTRSVRHQ